jgi:hypothetical protein
MLNNGEHLLITFREGKAQAFGLPSHRIAVWPSKLPRQFIRLVADALSVVAVKVAGCCVKEVNVIKDREAQPFLNIDIRDWSNEHQDQLIKHYFPEHQL